MKTFALGSFLILSFSFFGRSALGDERPSHTFLPDRGENCAFENAYQNGDYTCGTKRSEVWTCLTKGARGGAARATKFLLSGEIRSDVGSECSPTFTVSLVSKLFVKQN